MYNFFIMFFFGENLKMEHKVALCLVLLAILANGCLWYTMPQITSFVEWNVARRKLNFHLTHIVVAFGTFVNFIVLCIFRK